MRPTSAAQARIGVDLVAAAVARSSRARVEVGQLLVEREGVCAGASGVALAQLPSRPSR